MDESESDLPPPPPIWDGSWTSPNHLRILQNRVVRRENASHARSLLRSLPSFCFPFGVMATVGLIRGVFRWPL